MTALDCAFAVAGDVIERDYPPALYRALAALLPWLEDEPLAGVHPMRGLTPCPAGLLVGGRTRITLRVPEHRAEACAALQGADLQLASPLHVGRASRRKLLAYPVLHSRLVVTGTEDEAGFTRDAGGNRRARDRLRHHRRPTRRAARGRAEVAGGLQPDAARLVGCRLAAGPGARARARAQARLRAVRAPQVG